MPVRQGAQAYAMTSFGQSSLSATSDPKLWLLRAMVNPSRRWTAHVYGIVVPTYLNWLRSEAEYLVSWVT